MIEDWISMLNRLDFISLKQNLNSPNCSALIVISFSFLILLISSILSSIDCFCRKSPTSLSKVDYFFLGFSAFFSIIVFDFSGVESTFRGELCLTGAIDFLDFIRSCLLYSVLNLLLFSIAFYNSSTCGKSFSFGVVLLFF